MKKKLQKEIADLAAELGQSGGDFNVLKVKQAIRVIYEKLAVLEYLEGQLEGGDQSFDSKSFREQNWFVEPEPVPRPEHEEELVEPAIEKIKDILPEKGTVGYFTNREYNETDGAMYFVLTQYALSPLIIHRGTKPQIIIADVNDSFNTKDFNNKYNCRLLKNFGNGILVFRKREE